MFMKPMRAVLFANGPVSHYEPVRALLGDEDYFIAVDGGLLHMDRLGIQPCTLLGDLDSADPRRVLELEQAGVEVLRYPPEKNETDLELALTLAAGKGCRDILVIGALGGRLDHTLSNLSLLGMSVLKGCRVRLEDGFQEAGYLRAGEEVVINGTPGDLISLLPWEGAAGGVTTEGLKYPLSKEALSPQRSRGVSNVMLADCARVRVMEGGLIFLHLRSHHQAVDCVCDQKG